MPVFMITAKSDIELLTGRHPLAPPLTTIGLIWTCRK